MRSSAFWGSLFFFVLLAQDLIALGNTYPAEASSFYALRLPFKVDKVKDAKSYIYKFAFTRWDEDASFEKAVFLKQKDTTNSTIIQLPEFEKLYSWQVEYMNAKGKKIGESKICHFRVISSDNIDTHKYRIRVLANSYKDTGLHFLLDNTGAMYDMKGRPVWQSPQIANNSLRNQSSNLAVSPDNTITFIMNERAYETNYYGDILWTSPEYLPSGQKNAVHHEFVKRSNGNYMLLSWESEDRMIFTPETEGRNPPPSPVSFGTIEEYDKEGRSIWRWSSSVSFKNEELMDRMPTGLIRPRGRTHTNAFFFDEAERAVYVGFKDVSRIVKIRYPDKELMASYEGFMNRDAALFTEQHSIGKTRDGKMLVYSNNISASIAIPNVDRNKIKMESAVSSIVLLEPAAGGTDMKKVWEFRLDIDNNAPAASGRGGNVTEMADGNFFICMGASNRLLIVSPKGEVLFNAIVEEWAENDRIWQPYPQYRAQPVTADQLKNLIINSMPQ